MLWAKVSTEVKRLAQIPKLSDTRIALRVSPAAERALRRGHPWLYEGSIRKQNRDGQPGDLAVVFDRKGGFLAIGLYDPGSPIRVRILQSGQPLTIDGEWYRERIAQAARLRRSLASEGTTGYRLVNGENDGLPGLIIDRYAESYVLKLYTPAWLPHLEDVTRALLATVDAKRIVLRLNRSSRSEVEALYGLFDGELLFGDKSSDPVLFQENRLWFTADLLKGQKTGFFLDQRENRALVEAIVGDRPTIKRVLNVFAYTGGFSLYAARGGASEVTSLDLSRTALNGAEQNFLLNAADRAVAATRHETVAGDAFRILDELKDKGRQFELVVIDPPSFAKNRGEAKRAVRAYGRLTTAGLKVLQEGGVVVQASCSSQVVNEVFFDTVNRAAREVGRPLVEIERTGHPIDHPITFPQGSYLKCLFAVAP